MSCATQQERSRNEKGLPRKISAAHLHYRPGSCNFHSYLIAKRMILGGLVPKAMDFVLIPEEPRNQGSCERLVPASQT